MFQLHLFAKIYKKKAHNAEEEEASGCAPKIFLPRKLFLQNESAC